LDRDRVRADGIPSRDRAAEHAAFCRLDAEELSALWSERDTGTPGVERAREVIAERLARTAETGLAALPIRRRDERDHVSVEDVGDVVWLTRSLP
jgi:hypothetical protein